MKPEISAEDMAMAKLNVMSLIYGVDRVEEAVDLAIEYSDRVPGEYMVNVGMNFITLMPKSSTTSDPMDAVFSVHVPSFSVFIDEAGIFGPAKSAKEAHAEYQAAKAAAEEAKKPEGGAKVLSISAKKNRNLH